MREANELQPRGARRPVLRYLLTAIAAITLVGCSTPEMLAPSSENANRVAGLSWGMFAIAAFVFVVVEALLIYTAFRYRRRHGAGLPRQVSDNRALEIGWTAFPAVVLAVVFALTLATLRANSENPAPPSAAVGQNQIVNVRVIGHQWWWEYQYPDLKIVTANEMHIPVGARVNLDIESVDVIHSFWVPALGGKMDAIPGHVNRTWYKPTKTGTFTGQCGEFCGQEHALMHIIVVVDSADTFNAWVKNQQKPAAPATGALTEGENFFMSMPCSGCHTIDGTKAQGKVGPNLTHFGSRSTFAGASFDSTLPNVSNWIQHPREMKPGTVMPDLGVMPNMGDAITKYLLSLK